MDPRREPDKPTCKLTLRMAIGRYFQEKRPFHYRTVSEFRSEASVALASLSPTRSRKFAPPLPTACCRAYDHFLDMKNFRIPWPVLDAS